jgi:transcriptional regulator with GAF, ATPase, and Fis domain
MTENGEQPPSPAAEFAAIAARLRNGRTLAETFNVIVEFALSVIDGCDHAGIGVLTKDGFKTAAASDDIVRLVDDLQNDTGEGPCLEASTDQVWKIDNDLTHATQWPQLAAVVLERTPVRCALAFPLVYQGLRSGALNLFGDRPGAFDADAMDSAAILAAFASVAVTAAEERQRSEELREGLESNREIGVAIGMLMATHNITSEAAFQILSNASQRLNRKLRDIAAGIVRGDRPSQ